MTGLITLDFPILCLAVFCITYLIRYLDGPFDLLLKFRKLMGVEYLGINEHTESGEVISTDEYMEYIPTNKPLAKLVGCFWCTTVWFSAVMSIMYSVVYSRDANVFSFVVLTFAIAAVSGITNTIVDKLER